MSFVHKIRRILSLDRDTLFLLVEAYVFLGWARILIYMPFAKVASSFGVHMEETESVTLPENQEHLRQISYVIHLAGRHTLWQSKCMVRAIAGLKMLKRRGIGSTLYLGTGRNKAGKLEAHAWLRSGSYYITGAEEMARFKVVGTFASHANTKGD